MKINRWPFICIILLFLGSVAWNVRLINVKGNLIKSNKDLTRLLQYQKGETDIVNYDIGIVRDSVRVLKNHLQECKKDKEPMSLKD